MHGRGALAARPAARDGGHFPSVSRLQPGTPARPSRSCREAPADVSHDVRIRAGATGEGIGRKPQNCADLDVPIVSKEIGEKCYPTLLYACARRNVGLHHRLSDGDANPASPLTDPKGKRDDPLDPASDLEGDLHGHCPSLEAPRPRQQPGAGIGFKIRVIE